MADRVFKTCATALAHAAAEGVVAQAALPYPVETVKEALRVYAADLVSTGQATERHLQDLLQAYRALANFRPEEDVALVAEMSVPPDEETEREESSPERARLLAHFGNLVTDLNEQRTALEAEFREFLEGL